MMDVHEIKFDHKRIEHSLHEHVLNIGFGIYIICFIL